MTVWQTILVFVVIPAAAYGLIALLAGGSKGKRATRYRPGQEWTYAPVWWSGNPAGIADAGADRHGEQNGGQPRDARAQAGAAAGGASGNW